MNILGEFAEKDTDEALFVDAKVSMNDGDFTSVLAKIALMSTDYRAERKVINLEASAYAGVCGLRFLPFVDVLSGLVTTRMFPLLISHFRSGISATPTLVDACITAQNLLESIGTLSVRTADENLFLLMVHFAKIGVILSYYADLDQNGLRENSYDVCSSGGASRTRGGLIAEADIRQVGYAITSAISIIGTLNTSINLGNESLADINQACIDINTVNPAYNFCAVTSPAGFTAQQLDGVRSLLFEAVVVGLNPTNCGGGISTCRCF